VILYSWEGLKALLAPLFVLSLMCPIPWRVLVGITLPLKRHATVLATGLADLSGLDASLQGNLIHVPGISSLQVVDQCSGVRSFVSLVSIALLACLFWKRHWLLKAAVVLSCAPIAVVVNAVRIWLTAMLSVHVSPEAAQGFFHFFEGFVLFGAGVAALVGWAAVLGAIFPRRAPRPPSDRAPVPPAFRPGRPILRGAAAVLAIAALAGSAVGAERVRARVDESGTDADVSERMDAAFAGIPLEMGEYKGERHDWDEHTVKASGADVYSSVRYVDAAGQSYEIFVGGALRNDDNFHSPNVCMPTAGWETLAAAGDRHPLAGADGTSMQRLLLQRGEERMLVYYWFQAGDRLAGSEWQVRVRRLLDLLAGHALPPTLIVSVYVPVEDDVAAADAAAKRFLSVFAPHLRKATSSGDIHG